MKLVTYDAGHGPRAGVVLADGRILDLNAASGGGLPADMVEFLALEDGLAEARAIVAGEPTDLSARLSECIHKAADARLLAPIPRPGRVAALGLNYSEHCEEGGAELPSEPVVFCKASTSVVGPGQAIELPATSTQVDWEVEMAFVIGRRAKLVPAAEAMEYVVGYMVLNDVSARDYQMEKPGGQWHLGKSFDTFCPMGPWLVTKDEVPDPYALDISCEVSGDVMQSANTDQIAIRIPEIIEYLTQVFTLEPGDVVATGTPSGVGWACKPQRFLRPGDVVRCRVEGLGLLENPVR